MFLFGGASSKKPSALLEAIKKASNKAFHDEVADCEAIEEATKWLADEGNLNGYDYESAQVIFQAKLRRANRTDWVRALNEVRFIVAAQYELSDNLDKLRPLTVQDVSTCKRALLVMSFSGGHSSARSLAYELEHYGVVSKDEGLHRYVEAITCAGRTVTATLPQLEAIIHEARTNGVPALCRAEDFGQLLRAPDAVLHVGRPLVANVERGKLSALSVQGERTTMPQFYVERSMC